MRCIECIEGLNIRPCDWRWDVATSQRIKRSGSCQPVELYWEVSLGSRFALKCEIVMISETSLIQSYFK